MKYLLGSFPLWCRDYSPTNCDLGTIARFLSHEMWHSDNPWQANPIRVSLTKCDSGTFCDVFESSNMTKLLYAIFKSQSWLVGELCLGYGEARHGSSLCHISRHKNITKVLEACGSTCAFDELFLLDFWGCTCEYVVCI